MDIKKITKKLKSLDTILQTYKHIQYHDGKFYFEMQGISINVSMHQYFGKYIEVIETRNELFKYSKDGDNWFFRPEWFENDDILYIDKLFDDLFEEI